MSDDRIIKRLLRVEAMAEGLRRECYETRKLLEGGGSPPPKSKRGLSTEELDRISQKFHGRQLKAAK